MTLAVAQVTRRVRLLHEGGPIPHLDRSGHVRAGSGLAWLSTALGPRLVVAQDDTSFLAVLDRDGNVERSIMLAHEVEARRVFEARLNNKHHKLDLEAATTLPDGRVLVVGSGSTPARERVVLVGADGAQLFELPALYAALRTCRAFSGSEMNIEGAAVLGDQLILANRGNGAPLPGQPPVDALVPLGLGALVAHLDGGPVPRLGDVRAFHIGEVDGVRLTFTDLAANRGRLYFLASAEASPNTFDDGAVVGTVLGRIDGSRVDFVPILDEAGIPSTAKVEGLAWADPSGEGDEVLAVVDRDDPDAPSELLWLALPAAL